MSVISVCVIESEQQIISGFPTSVSITTNIPATIFYTLDGTTPTLFSEIYTSPIAIPYSTPTLVLSILATDGVNHSPVIVETYQTDILHQNARFPHSGTDACVNSEQATVDPAPFGSPPIQPNQQFLGPAAAGLTVYDELKPAGKPTGYDGAGNPTGFTNDQERILPTRHFPFIYSTNNAEGEMGYGIGTLPPNTVARPKAPPERSDINSQFFDPRAFVITQDLTQPVDPGLPVHINRSRFSWENVNRTREGGLYFNSGLDAQPVTGGFVRREFNSAKQTMTYYYFDSTQNKWLISTVPFSPAADQFNYAGSQVVRQGPPGSQWIYQWVPFKGNWLY